jgi:hypothetical protein
MDLRCIFLVKKVIEINHFWMLYALCKKYIILELVSIIVQDLSIVCL